MLADDGHRVVPQEGGAARHHLVEHAPQGVEVGPGCHLPAGGLLGGHVGHRAYHHALLGQAGTVQGQGQAKVADLGHAIGSQPDVARL